MISLEYRDWGLACNLKAPQTNKASHNRFQIANYRPEPNL
jgi:hypothetical protein